MATGQVIPPLPEGFKIDGMPPLPAGFSIDQPKPMTVRDAIRAAAKENAPTGSFFDNVAAGAGKTIYDVARGAGQRLRSVLPQGASDSLGLPTQADIDEARARDQALSDTVGGKVGQVAAALPVALIPGANTMAGSIAVGAGMGALQPTNEDESVLQNMAIGGAAGAAGKVIGDKAAGYLTGKLAADKATGAAQQTANAARDADMQAFRQAGLVVPPSQNPNAGMATRALEGLSNKINVQQTASVRNAEAVNNAARRALRLPADAPLNGATMQAVRKSAQPAYQALEALPAINSDPAFTQGIQSLARQKLGGVTSNPADAKITQLMDELSTLTTVDGKALIADIKNLRELAKANYSAASKTADVGAEALAAAQSKAAAMLEDLAERNLQANGAPADVVKNFREARKLIAKSHTVENAIREGADNVSAQKLAQALNRGAPLEGDLLTAAKFGNRFNKAAQSPETIGSVPMFTMTDLVAGAAGGAVNPALAALALARPAARNIALSGPVQNALAKPSYGPGMSQELLTKMAASPILRALLAGGAPAAALADGGKQ